ncbi:helix-turn-helix domain-containing protein [Oceanobacillus jeddahense]|uniref:helix-turn-helix domain-containing protein n=1 Tax=Oceanobacillus jeddahense TaxID=1462527 RepID=UPI003628B5EC
MERLMISKKIGQGLKRIRKEMGVTQLELANQIGISRSYLCDVENNRKCPNLKTVEKLANGFGMTFLEFIKEVIEDEKELQKKKIGSRIRVIRNELGLTMKEFGEKIDPPASDSIVSRWERGKSLPNNERLNAIAELGNVSISYLITGQKKYRGHSEE